MPKQEQLAAMYECMYIYIYIYQMYSVCMYCIENRDVIEIFI